MLCSRVPAMLLACSMHPGAYTMQPWESCMPSHMRTIRQAVALEAQCEHRLGTSGSAGRQREACRREGVAGIPPPRIEHQLKLVELIPADKGQEAVGQASWVVQTLPGFYRIGTRAHGACTSLHSCTQDVGFAH